MLKILYFIPGTGVGGIGKFVKDIVSHLYTTVNFTFVTLGDSNSELSLYLQDKGKVLNYPRWCIDVLRSLNNELKNDQYDIVHAHCGCWSFICLYFAKLAKVKKRIAHTHSADNFSSMNIVGKFIFILSRIFNQFLVTDYFACSDHACKITFGEKILMSKEYHRILNPVDDSFFVSIKHNVRKELCIPDSSKIVCHIGYMGYHKNQSYIINLAQCLKNKNIYWLLVGDGYNRTRIEQMVKDNNLKKVIILGIRKDIPDILKSSNILILPSLLEGLGTVVLEAQACGIPCIISENVTDETDLGLKLIKKIPLNKKKLWIKNILKVKKNKINKNIIKQVFSKYRVEINACVRNIMNIYMNEIG